MADGTNAAHQEVSAGVRWQPPLMWHVKGHLLMLGGDRASLQFAGVTHMSIDWALASVGVLRCDVVNEGDEGRAMTWRTLEQG